MAQLTATIPSVTSTNGVVHENKPINPEHIIRALPVLFGFDGCDRNLYPAIRLDLDTRAVQYWFYPLGDTATRDADLINVNNNIAVNNIFQNTRDISASIRQDSANWSGNGQIIFNARFTLCWFGEEDFDECNMHDPAINESGTALGVHTATTLQDTTKSWVINEWAGQAIRLSTGGAVDEAHRIVSNTADTITVAGPGFVGVIANGDAYDISKAAQMIIPADGKYLLPGRLTYSANAAGIRGIGIWLNNAFLDNYFDNPVGAVESAARNQAFSYNLLAGDVIEFYGYQSTGFNLNLLSFGLRNRFQAIAQRGVIKP